MGHEDCRVCDLVREEATRTLTDDSAFWVAGRRYRVVSIVDVGEDLEIAAVPWEVDLKTSSRRRPKGLATSDALHTIDHQRMISFDDDGGLG